MLSIAALCRNDVDYAYYCNGDVQWFGVHVADPDIKRAGFVTKWLGFAAQSLGRVQKADGSIVDREIETWLPKKKVKAFSLRWAAFPACHFNVQPLWYTTTISGLYTRSTVQKALPGLHSNDIAPAQLEGV